MKASIVPPGPRNTSPRFRTRTTRQGWPFQAPSSTLIEQIRALAVTEATAGRTGDQCERNAQSTMSKGDLVLADPDHKLRRTGPRFDDDAISLVLSARLRLPTGSSFYPRPSPKTSKTTFAVSVQHAAHTNISQDRVNVYASVPMELHDPTPINPGSSQIRLSSSMDRTTFRPHANVAARPSQA